ncbi:hypothetical protein MMC17_007389 [Xylographa soralifera]|nr:hypothetical protein [Xylographa soralifera]
MPPRPPLCARCLHASHASQTRTYASLQAITPAPPPFQTTTSIPPISRYPPTQPPSHRPPEFRKSQLHRQYTSLLRSSPLLLLFQHNNLRATEWMALRRELAIALRKADALNPSAAPLADGTKIQIVQGSLLAAALRVVEHWHPETEPQAQKIHASDPATNSSAELPNMSSNVADPALHHALSRAAYDVSRRQRLAHALTPLLAGPLAILSFPAVSPAHLSAALSILAPQAPGFPAPTRRANPGYYDLAVQGGVQKLMLLGARVEGRVLDGEGARWVGGMEGGLEGMRGRLVAMLQGVGMGVTGVLDGVGRGLYVTVEGRRGMLEEEKGKGKGEGA